ncbi:transmembrane 7 superfamily member 3-like isoform X2 [Tubulanus polymorphus]|uniref:transmembrane 7 superfamily member 3-like isoform X2 n=1 Tax=Tubulanus polymorphus TaxID=672921 RepID=UPI003DA3E074
MATFVTFVTLFLSLICVHTSDCLLFGPSRSVSITADVPTVFTVPGGSAYLTVTLNSIPDIASFVVFQGHSQGKQLTVSSSTRVKPSDSVTGTDAGYVTALTKGQTSVTWYISTKSKRDVSVIVFAKWHRETEPVPGGCNEEFNLELDPNLRIERGYVETILKYQYGNEGSRRGTSEPSCESQERWTRLRYDFYVYYLDEMDYSEKGLFDAMRRMMAAPNIIKYGTKMIEHYRGKTGRPMLPMASFDGIAAIYNVIVTDDNGFTESTAYVPVAVYNCDLQDDGSCPTKYFIPTMIVTSIAGILGLVLCFCGHKYFKFQQVMMGLISFTLLAYILLAMLTDLATPASLGLAVGCGIIGGILWLLFWWNCGVPVMSVLLTGLILGYLVSCIIFYTPFVWEMNFNYGMTFACGVLMVPVVLLYFTKTMSIISCSIVGSYLMIITASIALNSIMHHIVLHAIFKATISDYMKVKIFPPFQRNDMILSGVWLGLTVLGATFQFIRARNQADFPECPRARRKRRIEQRAQFDEAERRPLLIDYQQEVDEGILHALPGYGTQCARRESGIAPPAYTSQPTEVAPPRSSSPPPPYNPDYEAGRSTTQPPV